MEKINMDTIRKFEVMRAGKVVETFDSYAKAWKYASNYKGAVVRYYITSAPK